MFEVSQTNLAICNEFSLVSFIFVKFSLICDIWPFKGTYRVFFLPHAILLIEHSGFEVENLPGVH